MYWHKSFFIVFEFLVCPSFILLKLTHRLFGKIRWNSTGATKSASMPFALLLACSIVPIEKILLQSFPNVISKVLFNKGSNLNSYVGGPITFF